MHDAHFTNAMFFGATRRFFETAIDRYTKHELARKKQEVQRAHQALEDAARRAETAGQQQRLQQLRDRFRMLPETERRRIQQSAISNANSNFIRDRIRRRGVAEEVITDVLEEFARMHAIES